jgi:F0F1-type ATP synthase assembly protein I
MTKAPAVTTSAVQKATFELESMKRSLQSWLKYRSMNDAILAGTRKTRMPPGIAKQMVVRNRDLVLEQELATKLHALLTELDVKGLPDPDVRTNPAAAVQLATIAIHGGTSPASMGGILGASSATHPWLWPVLIVGGLLLAVTTAVKTAADVAKERERYACIQAGACTDYGFWLRAGGVAAVGWIAWKELGLRELVRGLLKRRG